MDGWSANGQWTGVRVRELLELVGTRPEDTVLVESLERDGPYRTSVLAPPHARDDLTLLALRLAGEPLHLDHGFPCRLIAPNRPGGHADQMGRRATGAAVRAARLTLGLLAIGAIGYGAAGLVTDPAAARSTSCCFSAPS